jgi:uncharacterized Zn finger protein
VSGWGDRWLDAAGVKSLSAKRGGRRGGRVFSFDAGTGGASAEVTGADGRRRGVSILLEPMRRVERTALLALIAGKARFAATLLAGKIPEGLEASLPANAPLFPKTHAEIDLVCDCGGAGGRCEHAEKLHRLLAERLDRDPVVLLEMRGIPRTLLVERLRDDGRKGAADGPGPQGAEPRTARPAAFPREPLPSVHPDLFFKPARPSGTLRVPLGPPENADAVLTILGPPPLEAADARELLVDLHRAVGVGARERLTEWEWRRVRPRTPSGS